MTLRIAAARGDGLVDEQSLIESGQGRSASEWQWGERVGDSEKEGERVCVYICVCMSECAQVSK